MGRRSINTTKSGKYMNPTDQARKEARKRELKKNKKQRIMVRMAVLKGKDPLKLIEEMDAIDEMEYDPTQPPKLSERVLKDKRRKLKETFERVLRMYEKEDPEYALELKRQQSEYLKRHQKRIQYYNEVKNAEQVELDQIPLPDMPAGQPMTSQIPLPSDIPLPHIMDDGDLQPKGILKKTSAYERPDTSAAVSVHIPKRKPPGPPPGPPPPLSDVDDDDEEENGVDEDIDGKPETVKQKKIRFEDDNHEGGQNEPIKYKHPVPIVSALQAKMLRLAGQDIPGVDGSQKANNNKREDRTKEMKAEYEDSRRRHEDGERKHYSDSEESENDEDIVHSDEMRKQEPNKQVTIVPPGPPPGLPPGPPPGLPPMMFRPPPLRAPPGAPPRMLPPGPPPGRPPGMPPGPPPGLPPTMRAMLPRLPPGPGAPPPRLVRPPGVPPAVAPPGVPPHSVSNPNVLSAPPSIMKLTSKGANEKKNTATIEAKPKIKTWKGDVTRFLPTALKVKREIKDSKGRIIRSSAPVDENKAVKVNPTVQAQTKDDAYETFMKEMEGLL
ncbi:hypothetical protein LSH36_131g02031 [Paralvinella palmiformis]|uniref:Wbp11/ELF5/Saf1 N-terminal domain-containing protein n=1 Tax=Paralvinella palmiformis TaxID=53620 RepID=A0AAD9JYG3_9ANNE|nr:hypothetical protein LSH36_131g02031 [Paralvinella palmiformis]